MRKYGVLALVLFVLLGCTGVDDPGMISGTVRDAYGNPLEGIRVSLDTAGVETTTDPTGFYRLYATKGKDTLLYTDGKNVLTREVVIGKATNLDLIFGTHGIYGSVRDSQGRGVEGVWVWAEGIPPVRTGSGGNYHLSVEAGTRLIHLRYGGHEVSRTLEVPEVAQQQDLQAPVTPHWVDSFTDLNHWRVLLGTDRWSTWGNTLRHSPRGWGDLQSKATATNMSFITQYRVLSTGPGGGVSFLVRMEQPYAGYAVEVYAHQVVLKAYGGNERIVRTLGTAQVGTHDGEWHTMEIDVRQANIRVWIDGKLLISATDPHNQYRSGGVGIQVRDSRAEFRNAALVTQ